MNVDAKLRSGNARPRRELRADFTQTISDHIQAHPRHRRMSAQEFFMKLLDKPAMAIAALVVAVVISGTAYAAANWPNITAIFGGEQQTPQGRIVKVDTANCHSETAFTVTKPTDQRGGPRYFRIKDGSKLTNDQVTQMVKGQCEQGAQSDVLLDKMKQNYHGDNVIGGYIDNTITALSATSITLASDIPMGISPNKVEVRHVVKTFNHIDPAVQIYYKTDTLQLSDLKVGDHIAFAYRATGDALQHSETMSPAEVNTDETTIVMIVKNTPDAVAAVNYQKYLGSEFEEVTPCKSTPSGYCTAEEYYQNK